MARARSGGEEAAEGRGARATNTAVPRRAHTQSRPGLCTWMVVAVGAIKNTQLGLFAGTTKLKNAGVRAGTPC